MTETAPTAAPAADLVNEPTPIVAAAPAAEPTADPVVVERARCAAIQAAARPGFAALAGLAVSEGWSPETFAKAQDSSAEAVASAARGAQAQGFAASFPAPVAGGGGEHAEAGTLEDKAKARFAADAKLQAEFGTVERYAAFVKAEAEGKVRVISRRA